jgi:hypothetical protein
MLQFIIEFQNRQTNIARKRFTFFLVVRIGPCEDKIPSTVSGSMTKAIPHPTLKKLPYPVLLSLYISKAIHFCQHIFQQNPLRFL